MIRLIALRMTRTVVTVRALTRVGGLCISDISECDGPEDLCLPWIGLPGWTIKIGPGRLDSGKMKPMIWWMYQPKWQYRLALALQYLRQLRLRLLHTLPTWIHRRNGSNYSRVVQGNWYWRRRSKKVQLLFEPQWRSLDSGAGPFVALWFCGSNWYPRLGWYQARNLLWVSWTNYISELFLPYYSVVANVH